MKSREADGILARSARPRAAFFAGDAMPLWRLSVPQTAAAAGIATHRS